MILVAALVATAAEPDLTLPEAEALYNASATPNTLTLMGIARRSPITKLQQRVFYAAVTGDFRVESIRWNANGSTALATLHAIDAMSSDGRQLKAGPLPGDGLARQPGKADGG